MITYDNKSHEYDHTKEPELVSINEIPKQGQFILVWVFHDKPWCENFKFGYINNDVKCTYRYDNNAGDWELIDYADVDFVVTHYNPQILVTQQ